MAAENRDVWMCAESSQKHFKCHSEVLDEGWDVIAPTEESNSAVVDVYPIGGVNALDGDLVFSMIEDLLDVDVIDSCYPVDIGA